MKGKFTMKTTIEIHGSGTELGAIADTIWLALTTFGYSCRLELDGSVTEPLARDDGTHGAEVEIIAIRQEVADATNRPDRLQ